MIHRERSARRRPAMCLFEHAPATMSSGACLSLHALTTTFTVEVGR